MNSWRRISSKDFRNSMLSWMEKTPFVITKYNKDWFVVIKWKKFKKLFEKANRGEEK